MSARRESAPALASGAADQPAAAQLGKPVPEANGDLVYTSDTQPGIRRRRSGSGYCYISVNGQPIRDEEILARIRKLAIPPAYRNVWICARRNGHLQATGYDARGRKQYRYHPRWREVRDQDKFKRMLQFGRALPRMHRRIAADLKLPGMSRDKVLATIVRLLETTLIRVGNEQYARDNHSYGLTTLRNRHVAVRGDVIRFEFRGKHGIRHHITVEDPRAAAVVRRCKELPEQELFEYIDSDGSRRNVSSSDVNAYLHEITGEPYTAKDFRTWYATMSALAELNGRNFTTAREAKSYVKDMLSSVSARLGNTPAMCRKCYVHPAVIDAFLAGELRDGTNLRRNQREQLLQLLRRISAPSSTVQLRWVAPGRRARGNGATRAVAARARTGSAGATTARGRDADARNAVAKGRSTGARGHDDTSRNPPRRKRLQRASGDAARQRNR
jgi:DNA topoisomerase-1